MDREQYHEKLKQVSRETEHSVFVESARKELDSSLQENPASLEERVGNLLDKYRGLAAIMGENDTVTLEQGVEAGDLGEGDVVCQIDARRESHSRPYHGPLNFFHNIFRFVVKVGSEDDRTIRLDRDEVLWDVKVQGENADRHEDIVRAFTSNIPKMEKSFDLLLEAACNPELNPEFAEEAQKLRDSLQPAV